MPICYAKGCRNSSVQGVKMNFFPKDPQRRALWTNYCKKAKATTFMLPNDHSALCEYHFTADKWEKQREDGKKKLKFNAVPTIFGDLVVQVAKKGQQNAPTKVHHSNTIMVHTNPHTKDIQILNQQDQKYQILLVNGPINESLKCEIIPIISKDSQMKEREEVSTIVNKNTSLLLHTNEITSFTEDEISQDLKNLINANDDIGNGKLQADEDSDTDSFIDKNFEPISDEEILPNEKDYENFEPITDDEIDSNQEGYLSKEEKTLKADIITEEHRLHFLLKRLNKSASKTSQTCKKCQRLEKACLRSEKIRSMMKRNHKHTYAILKRKIQFLENKIQILESNHDGLHKILNDDQIDFLGKKTKKVYKWSEETLQKANHYMLTFGRKAYQLLLNDNWPLPTLRTLRHKQEEKKKFDKRQHVQIDQTNTDSECS